MLTNYRHGNIWMICRYNVCKMYMIACVCASHIQMLISIYLVTTTWLMKITCRIDNDWAQFSWLDGLTDSIDTALNLIHLNVEQARGACHNWLVNLSYLRDAALLYISCHSAFLYAKRWLSKRTHANNQITVTVMLHIIFS